MFNSSSTAGVIHPPQTLSRGKTCLSRMATSNPAFRSFQAQDEPAGPPPTIKTSHASIVCSGACPQGRRLLPRKEARASTTLALRATLRIPPETIAASRCGKPLSIAPMFQSLGVVEPQILNVEHRKIPRLEDFKRSPQRRSVGTREDPFSDPTAEAGFLAAADEMHQSASGIADRAVDNFSEFRIAVRVHMLQHSHRHENIEFSRDIPVIVFNELHLSVQSLLVRALACKQNLFAGDIVGLHGHSILTSHVQR